MSALDWGYVSAVLSHPGDEIRKVEIDDSFLADNMALAAMQFISLYRHETGKVPPIELVKERFPSFVHDPQIEPAWLARELRQRKTFTIMQRGLSQATTDLQANSPNDALEAIDRMVNDIRAIQTGAQVTDIRRIGTTMREFYDDIKLGKMGIELPWNSLNKITRGLWPETVTFFVARPGTGKTFLAIIIARHATKLGKRVLIVSPEMNVIEVGERFFAIEAGVAYSDVISGSLSQLTGPDGRSAEERYFEALDGTGNGPYIIDDEDKLTAAHLESVIARTSPDLVAIDAAYLLPIGKGNRYERIISVVEWMRHISKVFHVAVVATSQLTKEAEKKGAIGQVAVALTDTINWDTHNLFALKQTPEMRDDGKLSIIPIKVRRMAKLFGRPEIDILWDMDNMRFDEIESQDGKEFRDEAFEDTAF